MVFSTAMMAICTSSSQRVQNIVSDVLPGSAGTRYLQKKNPVMDTIITGKMKNLLRSNSEQLIATKRIEEDRLEGVYKSKSLREFDELLVKPVYGFKDVDDYYSEHSCSSYLKVSEMNTQTRVRDMSNPFGMIPCVTP